MVGVIVGVTWAVLLVFDWFGVSDTNSEFSYENAPVELQLKSAPEEVLYSEAYVNEAGESEVKYAYMNEEVPVEEWEDLGRRTPNSQSELLEVTQEGNKRTEKVKIVFYAKPQFYDTGDNQWRQIEYATTTSEVFSMSGAIPHIKKREFVEWLLPGKPVFAAVSTFYPNPDVETTSVDGYVVADGGSWASVRGAATGSTVNSSSPNFTISVYSIDTGPPYYIIASSVTRAFFLFDTSTLPDLAIISDATLSLYATSKSINDNDGDDTANIVTSTPATNTNLVLADYNQTGTVLQAPAKDISSNVTLSTYNAFVFNSTGIGNVSLTGVSKFALREGHDLINSVPLASNDAAFSSAEASGTSQDPKLEVTYTTDSFSFGQWFPF